MMQNSSSYLNGQGSSARQFMQKGQRNFQNKKWLKSSMMIGAREGSKELFPDMGPAQECV